MGSGKESYINGTGHMTKMAAMVIYGKNLQKIFYRPNGPMIMKLCMEQYVLKLYKVYINDDHELTLTHFKTMSNLAKLSFVLTEGPDIRWAFTGPLVLWYYLCFDKNCIYRPISIVSVLM